MFDYCQNLIQSLDEDYAYYSSEINEPIELAEKLVESIKFKFLKC